MIRTLLATSALCIASTAAIAGPYTAPEPPPPYVVPPQTPTGTWYGVVSLGYLPTSTADAFQETAAPDFQDIEIDLGAGHALSAAIGYEMPSGLRTEVEALYLHQDTGDLFFPDAPFTFTSDGGTFSVTAGMANVWYSFGSGAIRPFVGGGIGMAHVGVDLPTPPGGPGDVVDDTDTAVAWQIGAGVDYALSDTMSLTAAYRYIDVSGLTFTDSDGDDLDADYNSHLVTVGVRFSF